MEMTDWKDINNIITKNFIIYQIEPEDGKQEYIQNCTGYWKNILNKCIFSISGCYEQNVDYKGHDLTEKGHGLNASSHQVR